MESNGLGGSSNNEVEARQTNVPSDPHDPLTYAIAAAIADREGICVTDISDELGITLGDYIDLEAVESLFNHSEGRIDSITFEVEEYSIEVASASEVYVEVED